MDNFIFFAAIVIAIVLVVAVLESRCPNCGRVFAASVQSRRTTEKGFLGVAQKELVTRKCRYCKHVWSEEEKIDNSPGNW